MSPAPKLDALSISAAAATGPLPLKVKGGKPFGVFSRLEDGEALARTWKVASKVASELEQGHRIENLSWRLWHLKDVIASGNSGSGKHTAPGEGIVHSIGDSLARTLEKEKKKDILELKAPDFRWTDGNDAVRHLAIVRLQKRNASVGARTKGEGTSKLDRGVKGMHLDDVDEDGLDDHPDGTPPPFAVGGGSTRAARKRARLAKQGQEQNHHHGEGASGSSSSSSNVNSGSGAASQEGNHDDSVEMAEGVATGSGDVPGAATTAASARRQVKTEQKGSTSDDSSSGTSSGTSSGSTSASLLRLRRRRRQQERAERDKAGEQQASRRSSTPPVCWQLTEAAARQQQSKQRQRSESSKRAHDPNSSAAARSTSRGRTNLGQATPASPAPTSSTWTLEDIEAAERELIEQGVDMSGPFAAMLADLKRGGLTRLNTVSTPPIGSMSGANPLDSAGMILKDSNTLPGDPSNRASFPSYRQNVQLPPRPPPVSALQQQGQQQQQQQQLGSPMQSSSGSFYFASPVSVHTMPLQASASSPIDNLLHGMSLPASPSSLSMAQNATLQSWASAGGAGGAGGAGSQQPYPPHNLAHSTAGIVEHRRRSSNLSMLSRLPDSGEGQRDKSLTRVKHESHDGSSSKEKGSSSKPQCTNCGATSTPLWRRDANFDLQCNACGLYLKLHKVPRPRAMKHRRADRKRESSPPTGEGSKKISPSRRSSCSSGSGKDEWMGIHAGSSCANCGTSTTPLWRKDPEGRIICNACGLYYKLHNAHRPVTMRMDAIKRRSRYDDRIKKSTGQSEDGTNNDAATPSMSTAGDSMLMDVTAMGPNLTLQQNPLHQHHHQALHQNSASSSSMNSMNAIQIPAELWDHQLCPMGAWGENCCQNLPQPEEDQSIGVSQSQIGLPGLSSSHHAISTPVDQVMNPMDVSTMASILGDDWLIDYPSAPANTPGGPPSTTTPGGSIGGGGVVMTGDSTSVGSSAPNINANAATPNIMSNVVGPTYQIKKRKVESASPSDWWFFTANQGAQGAEGEGSASTPSMTPRQGNVPLQQQQQQQQQSPHLPQHQHQSHLHQQQPQ